MPDISWERGTLNTSTGAEEDNNSALRTVLTHVSLGAVSFIFSYADFSVKERNYDSETGLYTLITDVAQGSVSKYLYLYDASENFLGRRQISSETTAFNADIFFSAAYFRFVLTGGTAFYSTDPGSNVGKCRFLVSASLSFETVQWTYNNDIWRTPSMPSIDHGHINTPIPLGYWRIESGYNDGYPYHKRLGDIKYIPPEHVWTIRPDEQIQVYEYTATQEQLESGRNGDAIIFPESCTSRHELNGRWDITLTHKIDKHKKWEYLKYENILKVSGQLFRIDTQQTQINYEQQTITVHANHIFYDLNHRIIQRDNTGNERAVFVSDSSAVAAQTFWDLLSERPYPKNAISYWQNELNSQSKYIPVMWDTERGNEYIFEKHYSSTYENKEQPSMDYHGKTVVDLLIGSDGFINRWGGEIYRDNFYFSINPTIEDCKSDSFLLRFPVELKSQIHGIDTNQLATIISFIDMNGNYAHGDVTSVSGLHHHRPVVVQLSIPYSAEVGSIIWNDYNKVTKTMDVELNELKYNHRYKDKKAVIPRYHVGDKGYIMVQNQKEPYRITAVERDEITKDYISITFKRI